MNPQEKDTSRKSLHGGIVLKGEIYFVELVATHESIKIYPMAPLSIKEVEIKALYSPRLSKANWSLPLDSHSDHFAGSINERGSKAYQVYVHMKVNGKKEFFNYLFRPHEL